MAKKPATQNVSLTYPLQYFYSCMANRFTLAKEEGFVLAHFGLLSKKNVVLDRFSCVFPDTTLDRLRDNLVNYSSDIKTPKTPIPPWPAPELKPNENGTLGLPVIDFVHVTNWGDAHAEICFWSYSQGQLSEFAAKKQTMTPWGVAMLRCDLNFQREFLIELYEV
jgi:hypothetical protein